MRGVDHQLTAARGAVMGGEHDRFPVHRQAVDKDDVTLRREFEEGVAEQALRRGKAWHFAVLIRTFFSGISSLMM